MTTSPLFNFPGVKFSPGKPLSFTPKKTDMLPWISDLDKFKSNIGLLRRKSRCMLKPLSFHATWLLHNRPTKWSDIWPAFGLCTGNICSGCAQGRYKRNILPLNTIVRQDSRGLLWLMDSADRSSWAGSFELFKSWEDFNLKWIFKVGIMGEDECSIYFMVSPVNNHSELLQNSFRSKSNITAFEFYNDLY